MFPGLYVFRCLDFLLDNGANPTLKNSKGYSAVHYAAACGNKQHLELVSGIIDLDVLMLSFVKQLKIKLVFFFFSFASLAALGGFL